jgi:hypothetical protein
VSVEVPVCGQCGERHVTKNGGPACIRHCSGRLRPERRGKACTKSPMHGQQVCDTHGGKAPRAKAAAEVRLVQAQVATLAASLADPVDGEDRDPGEIIYDSIRVQTRLVAYFWQRVCALDPRALIWGKTKEKIGGDDGGITFEPKAHAWFVLWRDAVRERDRLCIEAIRVGLEQRRVELAERDEMRWMRFLDGLLTDFGLDPNAPATAEVVERHLRLLA